MVQPTLEFVQELRQSNSEVLGVQEIEEVRLLFGGDMMFDRSIRQSMQKRGSDFPLGALNELFHSYDAVIANLEGPVTTFPSKSVNSAIGSPRNFLFTFDPAVPNILMKHNVQLVSLGNNHITNFGTEGVEQTKTFLNESAVGYFGYTGLEEEAEQRIALKNWGGRTFAFVGVNQFVQDGWKVGEEDIRHARTQADIIVVMPHWGNEYQPQANKVIQEKAHAFIDAGADLIVGAHPHVVQQSEEYKGKKIYYSLGNLVFDQYFSKETQRGILLEVIFAKNGTLSFKEIPVQLHITGQTTLLEE